jgi:hypothetical protein
MQTPTASTPPRPIRGLDPERVRLPLERELAGRLASHPLVQDLRGALAVPDPAAVRRRLMGGSLRLSEGMAPDLHATAANVLRILGIAKPLEIYQSSGQENASIHLIESPILIEVQGRMITLLDKGSMTAVIGHELGHYLAHGPWGALGEISGLANALVNLDDIDEEVHLLASSLSMAKELTADRFGLLACQDLADLLRLEMISTTGLPGDALTWDTDAYLAQCRELMEQCLLEGSTALGVTHPEHNLRVYAAWLFSETSLYRELTGRGPGTRSMEEVDATLARTLSLPDLDPTYQMLEGPPPEVHACALACAVIVANADGEFADQESEAIERVFAPIVPEYRRYFDVAYAKRRFQELRSVMAAFGPAAHRSLFSLLAHVVGADGVIDPREIECVVEIGDAIGAGVLFRSLLRSLLRSSGLQATTTIQIDLTTEPRPVEEGEARAGLDAYLSGMALRGGGETTVRRLLRLVGDRKRTTERAHFFVAAFRQFGLECASDLESIELDAVVTLTSSRQQAEPGPSSLRRREPLDRASARITQGLAKLRDQLVSGDGRSPSVRLHATRPGRAFDLHSLESVSVGLSERVLAKARVGTRTPIVAAAEAGKQDGARTAARELLLLDRENRSRVEETGANDLALGYPFITGLAGGYYVRGPLVLHPVDQPFQGDFFRDSASRRAVDT